jgi:hypothetical protein
MANLASVKRSLTEMPDYEALNLILQRRENRRYTKPTPPPKVVKEKVVREKKLRKSKKSEKLTDPQERIALLAKIVETLAALPKEQRAAALAELMNKGA